MTIRHDDGHTEKIYATTNFYGVADLGIDAVSPAYREKHPHDCEDIFYPLSSYALTREWEICDTTSDRS